MFEQQLLRFSENIYNIALQANPKYKISKMSYDKEGHVQLYDISEHLSLTFFLDMVILFYSIFAKHNDRNNKNSIFHSFHSVFHLFYHDIITRNDVNIFFFVFHFSILSFFIATSIVVLFFHLVQAIWTQLLQILPQ